ncbi:MAG: Ada metal-binding domain-containing protein [Gammaproteobacteria bacterium]|nr:Ada metal-binding domain-containing protein [Gammaproteobacteria bacterium]
MLPEHHICEGARLAREPRFDGAFFVGVLTNGIYCPPSAGLGSRRRFNDELDRVFGRSPRALRGAGRGGRSARQSRGHLAALAGLRGDVPVEMVPAATILKRIEVLRQDPRGEGGVKWACAQARIPDNRRIEDAAETRRGQVR